MPIFIPENLTKLIFDSYWDRTFYSMLVIKYVYRQIDLYAQVRTPQRDHFYRCEAEEYEDFLTPVINRRATKCLLPSLRPAGRSQATLGLASGLCRELASTCRQASRAPGPSNWQTPDRLVQIAQAAREQRPAAGRRLRIVVLRRPPSLAS